MAIKVFSRTPLDLNFVSVTVGSSMSSPLSVSKHGAWLTTLELRGWPDVKDQVRTDFALTWWSSETSWGSYSLIPLGWCCQWGSHTVCEHLSKTWEEVWPNNTDTSKGHAPPHYGSYSESVRVMKDEIHLCVCWNKSSMLFPWSHTSKAIFNLEPNENKSKKKKQIRIFFNFAHFKGIFSFQKSKRVQIRCRKPWTGPSINLQRPCAYCLSHMHLG